MRPMACLPQCTIMTVNPTRQQAGGRLTRRQRHGMVAGMKTRAVWVRRCGAVVWGAWALWAVAAAELETWPQNRPAVLGDVDGVQVVNVWATWCAPCRREMPLLSRWAEAQRQSRQRPPVTVVGVALDQNANIAAFVRQTPVRYPIWRYSGRDSRAWMQRLGNPVGALPFTLIRAPRCGFQTTLLGEVDAAKLDAAVAQARRQCAQRTG